MKNFHVICATVLIGFSAVPALAEDSTALTVLETATTDMMKGLDENQTKQFSAINNSYGIIRSVEDVQQSISRAVQSCSSSNPNLKDAMSTRFEAWKDNVRPVMKKARTKLDKMILLQGFAQPSAVRAYLKKFDAAIVYRNQKLKPVPITAAEDCQKLQSSMDASQSNLVNLITDTLALNADLKIKQE